MSQIASALSLSRTTVSLALSGDWRSVGIAAETRDQVVAKARQLGYRPNPLATGLRTQITKTIGIAVPNLSGDAYEHMLHGIETAVGDDYTLLLGVSEYDEAKERRILQSFQDRLVDGLILIHSGHPANVRWMKQLLEFEIPIVQADRCYREITTDVVEADNEGIGALMAEHFIRQGYRDICFLRTTHVNSSTLGRAKGYEKAMRRHGLTPRLIPELPIASTQDRSELAYAHTRRLLRRPTGPLAILTHDISLVFGALQALRDAGLEDSKKFAIGSVANASNNPMYDFLPPNLTLVVWSVKEMGFQAASLLMERMHRRQGEAPRCRTIRIPGRLSVRNQSPQRSLSVRTKQRKEMAT
jgi:LacI family transcriptional regulator